MAQVSCADAFKYRPIFFGGTFDPVRIGHIAVANQVQLWADAPSVTLIPVKTPAHKILPQATARDRVAMIGLAIADYPTLKVSDIEVSSNRDLTYTIDTVKELYSHTGERICWVLGQDSADSIGSWRQADQLSQYMDLIVVDRADANDWGSTATSISDAGWAVISAGATASLSASGTPIAIRFESMFAGSSQQVRANLTSATADYDERFADLHPSVSEYIRENNLYGID